MNLFVKAKAWQIFLLSFGIPCGFAFLAGFLSWSSPYGDIFPILITPAMALFIGIPLAWLWSLGKFFNQSIREDIRPRDTWFRRGLVYVSIYMTLYSSLWVACIVALRLEILPTTTTRFGLIVAVAVLFAFLHLLTMAAKVYVLYFLSKNLAILARESGSSFGQSTFANFFLFWFFPIGVWFIQPMVSRMWREQAA